MFCSFARDPAILRRYGRGRVVQIKNAAWPALRACGETRGKAEASAYRREHNKVCIDGLPTGYA